MKTTGFSEAEIFKILKEAEGGMSVPDLCCQYGIRRSFFYKWRSRYGGMDASMISEIKSLQQENARLKRMYADLRLKHEVLQDVMAKFFLRLSSIHAPTTNDI